MNDRFIKLKDVEPAKIKMIADVFQGYFDAEKELAKAREEFFRVKKWIKEDKDKNKGNPDGRMMGKNRLDKEKKAFKEVSKKFKESKELISEVVKKYFEKRTGSHRDYIDDPSVKCWPPIDKLAKLLSLYADARATLEIAKIDFDNMKDSFRKGEENFEAELVRHNLLLSD